MKANIIRRIAAVAVAAIISAGSLVSAQNPKSVSILGDSYSTYENFVEPKSNISWYRKDRKKESTDVREVEKTWWHQLITENGYKLDRNNSYSGSTVCTTGYGKNDYTDRAFITRMDNLGNPDIILIFGATNDSWADSPIGEFVWSGWTKEQLKSFRPALTYMLSYMTDRYPNTEMLYIINDGLKPEITTSIVEACDHYGVPYVQLKDIDKTDGHPNIHGMRQITDQVAAALAK
ncbi:MAG: SGNH/GDSL hydrolase family protein [Muribaculaceae bacterium]|nr:SGNH/GDSL hydrolase family protein [Muribaculaceae bacterium]MDE6551531.1 SGNH/GDSL hydrolase family protein [Muribaculaceae bacterium]